ncbi:MAG: hypothetical protein M3R23_08175 [Actinomycetota bacterium]|nr:hypothetical protein [Actinomycetota bacterium]
MTKLSGKFQTDLAPPDALAACAQAIDGLGWCIESVEGDRIVSYAESGSTPDPPRIEVVVSASGRTTDVRIIGTDTDANPLETDELIAELNRARDAIKASVESADQAAGQESSLAKVPLFHERSRGVQIITAVIVPAGFGAVAGIVLGISAAGYWAIQVVALIGAVVAGLEHPNGREGAWRGLVGGTLFGTFLLIAHAVAGTDETVKLPDFAPILVVFTAVIGMLASALGGRLRGRSERPAP